MALTKAGVTNDSARRVGIGEGRCVMVGVCSKIPIEQRLEDCSRLDPETGCVNWIACRRQGYGFISYLGRQQFAHRLAYALVNGPIPAGMCVCHKCDNPACINVAHLFLGTKKENSQDMARKGRAPRTIGEAAGRAKISEEDALAIINSSAKGKDLAATYGITPTQVYFIKNGKSWKHLHERLRAAANDPEK